MTPNNQHTRVTILIVALAVSLTASSALVAGAPIDTDSDAAVPLSGLSDERSSVETSDGPDIAIQEVGYEGQAIVRTAGGVTYLFEDESHQLETTVETGEWNGEAELCVWIAGEDDDGESEPQAVTCESLEPLDEHSVTAATINFESWMGNETGETTLHVAIVGDPDGLRQTLDETTLNVRVLAKDEDVSASGLTTEQELAHGTDFLRADTDGDGLTDGQEIREIGTDPLTRDTAGNGIPDGMEVMLGTDPTNPWTPHLYLLILAIPFGIGIIVLGAAAGRIEHLGRRWTSNRSSQITDTIGGQERSLSAPVDRGQRDFGGGGWSTPQDSDGMDQFVTDEERVIRLLEQNDGRMPQSELVEETDWSKSKVSRLLSRMEEEGTITKIPIGRTNLVALGGRDEFTNPLLGGEA